MFDVVGQVLGLRLFRDQGEVEHALRNRDPQLIRKYDSGKRRRFTLPGGANSQKLLIPRKEDSAQRRGAGENREIVGPRVIVILRGENRHLSGAQSIRDASRHMDVEVKREAQGRRAGRTRWRKGESAVVAACFSASARWCLSCGSIVPLWS